MAWLPHHLRSFALRAGAPLLALSVVASACASSAREDHGTASPPSGKYLTGQLLVAAPNMPDPRFAKTVIFLVRHNEKGAMGLVVNRVLGVGSAAQIAEGAGAGSKIVDHGAKLRIHYGGPVQPMRGYVLHSGDYAEKDTLAVTDKVSVTAAAQILRDIAEGHGPDQVFLAVGYAGWGPGQLEAEIAHRDWVVIPSDAGIVFGADMAVKWRRAMDQHGIDL